MPIILIGLVANAHALHLWLWFLRSASLQDNSSPDTNKSSGTCSALYWGVNVEFLNFFNRQRQSQAAALPCLHGFDGGTHSVEAPCCATQISALKDKFRFIRPIPRIGPPFHDCGNHRFRGRRTDTSPRTAAIFFSSSPKKVTVTMLPLFCSGTLLCGRFLFIKLSEGPVQLTDNQIDTPSIHAAGSSIHTGLVCQYCASDTIRRVSYTEVIEMFHE